MSTKQEQERKYYKLVFRKLPERGYTETDFKENLSSLYLHLGIQPSAVYFAHFIDGKSSRRRGPISSTGFITILDESVTLKILKYFSAPGASFISPSKINPSMDIDDPTPVAQLFYKQPEVSLALYSKGFKPKERPDKLQGTYEDSDEYKAFIADMNKPLSESAPITDSSNEKVYDKIQVDDPKNTPMLIYLRKIGEKRAAERREATAAAKASKGKGAAEVKTGKKSAPAKEAETSAEKAKKKSRKTKVGGPASTATGSSETTSAPAVVSAKTSRAPREEGAGRGRGGRREGGREGRGGVVSRDGGLSDSKIANARDRSSRGRKATTASSTISTEPDNNNAEMKSNAPVQRILLRK